jgi:hypothetical protein
MNPKGSVLRIVVAILFVLGIAAFFIPIVPYGTVTMSPADTGKDSTAMFDSEDKKEAEALEVLETGDSYSGFKLLGGLLKKDDLKPKFSMKLDDISDTLGVDIPKKVHVKFSLIIGILLIASLVVAAFAALTCFVGAFSSALKGKLTPILGILSIILLIATFVFLITGVGASDGGGKTKDVIAMGIFECSFAISWGGYVVGGVLLVGTVLAFIAAAQYSVFIVTGIE